MPKSTPILATLTRGKTYSFRDGEQVIRFVQGVGQPVTEAQRARLEAEAFDLQTVLADPDDPVSGRNEKRAKFKFTSSAAA